MTNEIVPHSDDSNSLSILDTERLNAFAGAADNFVSQNTFAMYRNEKRPNTLRAHDADLKAFSDFLHDVSQVTIPSTDLNSKPDVWQAISYGIVKLFVEYLINQDYALGTVNRRLATVRKYAGLAFEAGHITAEQIALIKTVKGFTGMRARNRDEKREQVRKLDKNGQAVKKSENVKIPESVVKKLKNEHADNPQGLRDRLLLCLLLDHAMRASEASALLVDYVDFEAETIRFYRIKTDTWQTDKLTDDSLSALKAYRPYMLATGKPLLRGSKKNNQLVDNGISARTVTRIVNKLGNQHGLERLSAHDCRHSWATRARLAKTHPQDIMEGGGWKTMTMVNRYTDELEISNENVSLKS